jgi:hypothetical protein
MKGLHTSLRIILKKKNNMNHNTYKPSGHISISLFFYLPILALIFIPLISYAYSYAIWNIPFVYLNFMLTFLFGLLTFLVTLSIIKLGKVRNKVFSIILSLIISSFSLYLHWASWISFVAHKLGITLPIIFHNNDFLNSFSPAFFPHELFKTALIIIENGVWSLFRLDVNGILYLVIVIVEGLTVYVVSLNFVKGVSEKPFCEKSNTWMVEKELPKFELIKNIKPIITSIENNNLDILPKISFCKEKNVDHSLITLYHSEFNYYLKLENKIAYIDMLDSNEFKTYVIIDNVKVESEYLKGFLKAITSDKKNINTEDDNYTIDEVENINSNDNLIAKNEYSDIYKEVIKENKEEFTNEEKQNIRNKKSSTSKIYVISGLLILVLSGLFMYLSSSKNSYDDTYYKDTIKELLIAEENRDIDKILTYYSDSIVNYWSIINPSKQVIRNQYKKSWKITSSTKNHIQDIKKITDNIYDLYTEFEYYNKKKKKRLSVNSRIRFVFDKSGKLYKVYGLE